MKRFSTLFLILCVFCFVLTGCNFPKLRNKDVPTEVPTAEVPAAVPETEEELMIQNSENSESTDDSLMIQNNSGTSGSSTNEELPMIQNNSENNGSTTPSEDLMITNPNQSSVSFPKTASLSFRAPSTMGTNAQIQRPDSNSNDDNLVIVNDHTVTYPENQPVIQKSTPSGQLTPLSYIPANRLPNGSAIQFDPGATSAVISGYIQPGETISYNLYAFANQNFLMLLSSDSGTSVLSMSDVYGNVFLDASQRQTSYTMYLPRTCTYYVNIHSQGYAENFTLQVFIPARVTIPPKQVSTSMSGTLSPYSVVSYTAYIYAGQTARIDDYSGPQPTSFLRVSGLQTGQVYMDYTAYSPSWYSVVPTTQDYLIEVISMDQPSYYKLTVDVR